MKKAIGELTEKQRTKKLKKANKQLRKLQKQRAKVNEKLDRMVEEVLTKFDKREKKLRDKIESFEVFEDNQGSPAPELTKKKAKKKPGPKRQSLL